MSVSTHKNMDAPWLLLLTTFLCGRTATACPGGLAPPDLQETGSLSERTSPIFYENAYHVMIM